MSLYLFQNDLQDAFPHLGQNFETVEINKDSMYVLYRTTGSGINVRVEYEISKDNYERMTFVRINLPKTEAGFDHWQQTDIVVILGIGYKDWNPDLHRWALINIEIPVSETTWPAEYVRGNIFYTAGLTDLKIIF